MKEDLYVNYKNALLDMDIKNGKTPTREYELSIY